MKFYLFLLLFFLSTNAIESQTIMGIKSGLFFGKQEYKNEGKSDLKIGIEAGILARISFLKKFYIQPEFTFLQKGGKREYGGDQLDIKTNQLEAAILTGYNMELSKFSFFINTGIYYGRVLSESTEGRPFMNLSYIEFFDNNTDWGLIFGGGISIEIGKNKEKLIFESRYRQPQNTFRTIVVGPNSSTTAFGTKLKNIGFGLNITYLFFFLKNN